MSTISVPNFIYSSNGTTITTTDATALNVTSAAYTIPNNSVVTCEIWAMASQGSFLDQGGFYTIGTYQNHSGTVTRIGASNIPLLGNTSIAGWTGVDVAISGATIMPSLGGKVATTLKWGVLFKVNLFTA